MRECMWFVVNVRNSRVCFVSGEYAQCRSESLWWVYAQYGKLAVNARNAQFANSAVLVAFCAMR